MKLSLLSVCAVVLASTLSASASAQNCTGCSASVNGLQEVVVHDPAGGTLTVLLTTYSGFCQATLGEGGIDCVGSGCDAFASFGAVGMPAGMDIFECQGFAGSKSRDDCKRPPGKTDSNGTYVNEELYHLGCSGNESYFSLSIPPLVAEVKVTCQECSE